MAVQPDLHNSRLQTIKNGVYFALGTDVHVFNHGSGDFPALLRHLFAGNDQLVEVHDPDDLSKFNIRTQKSTARPFRDRIRNLRAEFGL